MTTTDEREALLSYTRSAFDPINRALRGEEPCPSELAVLIPLIDAVFRRSRASANCILFRGIGSDAARMIRANDPDVGDEFSDAGYASASSNLYRARHFTAWPDRGLILQIHVRAGQHALDMRSLSDNPDELEVLLPRGTLFRVTAAEDERSILQVEVVDA